jgi:hypothetical protein
MQVARIVEEYVLWTKEVEYSVKGRVIEHVGGPNSDRSYEWEISHHYRPSLSAAAVYYPSARTGTSAAEVRALMLTYLKGFQNIDVEPNLRY